jgi:putative endonuclease
MGKRGYVYIMTNRKDGVLYTGVTSHLQQRTCQHKNDLIEGFTKKYRLHLLVYYEIHDDIGNAILYEKKLKNLHRQKKIALIERMNPEWRDLYDEIMA